MLIVPFCPPAGTVTGRYLELPVWSGRFSSHRDDIAQHLRSLPAGGRGVHADIDLTIRYGKITERTQFT